MDRPWIATQLGIQLIKLVKQLRLVSQVQAESLLFEYGERCFAAKFWNAQVGYTHVTNRTYFSANNEMGGTQKVTQFGNQVRVIDYGLGIIEDY